MEEIELDELVLGTAEVCTKATGVEAREPGENRDFVPLDKDVPIFLRVENEDTLEIELSEVVSSSV